MAKLVGREKKERSSAFHCHEHHMRVGFCLGMRNNTFQLGILDDAR